MKLSTFLLLAAVSGAWGQTHCYHESKEVPCLTVADKGITVGTAPVNPLPIPCSASEGKSDHPPFATCWNDKAMNLHCSDLPEPEPMDVPAIKQVIGFSRDSCPAGAFLSFHKDRWRCERWTCKKGSGRILLEDVDHGWHCLKFPKE